jgi:hypothetical protein
MDNLKRYNDFTSIKEVEWTNYIIIVPTEKDRKELMDAFEHIHYSNIDTDIIAVNQLAHEYLDETRNKGSVNNIIVDDDLFNQLKSKQNGKY